MDKLIYKGYQELAQDIKSNIHKIGNSDYELVVGIPRSGMIPAYMISAYLNIDCIDFDGYIANAPLQHGITRKTKYNLKNAHDAKKVLIVDDSVYSGKSMKQVLEKLPSNLSTEYKTLAIYSTNKNPKYIDLYLIQLNGLKLFEWGIFHNAIISKTCFDMDGVLCEDLDLKSNYNDNEYIHSIINAKLKFQPTGTIHSIITNRQEKYREQTVEWLSKHKINYSALHMLPNIDRDRIDPSIDHKAKHYRKAKDAILFIESDLTQSEKICLHSGKPSYCIDTAQFFSPNTTSKIFYNKTGVMKSNINYIKHRLKNLFN